MSALNLIHFMNELFNIIRFNNTNWLNFLKEHTIHDVYSWLKEIKNFISIHNWFNSIDSVLFNPFPSNPTQQHNTTCFNYNQILHSIQSHLIIFWHWKWYYSSDQITNCSNENVCLLRVQILSHSIYILNHSIYILGSHEIKIQFYSISY